MTARTGRERYAMKHHIGALAAVVALALAAGACDDGLTDVNDNPNGPLDVPAQNLLAYALSDVLDGTIVYFFNQDLTELWVQHMAEIQYAEQDVFVFRSESVNGVWAELYSDPLINLERIVEKNAEAAAPNENQVAVARIAQSWIYGIMTDVWGDIPYSEALTGHTEEGTVTPAYDPQQAVYDGILATLATAAGELSSGTELTLQEGDLLYGGDMDAWRRFANSLRLRYAMHLADIDPSKAQAEAAAAVTAGVFTSAAQQADFHYTGTSPYWNPIYDNSRTRDDHRMSATFIDRLEELDDPRLAVYAQPVQDPATRAGGTVYEGMPNGVENHTFGLTTKSKFGVHFFSPSMPYHLITYAEVLFLIAEAELRGWDISGMTAQQAYEAAVTAAFELYEGVQYVVPGATPAADAVGTWSVSQAEIDAYMSQADVDWTNTGTLSHMQKIALQKWILLFNQGVEAYVNWRRMDYPVLTPGVDATYAPGIPVRIPYPSDEEGYNGANLEAAKSNQGISSATDQLMAPLWWDVD